jgi:hypothetical protein
MNANAVPMPPTKNGPAMVARLPEPDAMPGNLQTSVARLFLDVLPSVADCRLRQGADTDGRLGD